MDVNTYGFAYKEYDFKITSALGISGEAAFDPYIFDFDAFEGQDSVRFNQIEIVTDVLYSTTHPQGYAVIYLPDLPGFDQDNIQDPSGVGLMTASSLSKTLGMYLIIIAGTQGSSDFDYTIYPDLPNDRNAEVLATSLNDAAGAKITITYDSLYLADTGPGVSAVYPFRKDLPSTTQPVLITLPQGSRTSAFRFYRGDRAMDFDLYGGADVAPQGDLIQNAIPANLIEIKKL
jgi:hypothetical protein